MNHHHHHPQVKLQVTTTPPPPYSPPSPSEICAGRDAEQLDQVHDDPAALARHLEVFLGHRSAETLILECGTQPINDALQELPHAGTLRSAPGWLTWRSRQLRNGARPTPPPAPAKEDPREKFRRDYELRWGAGDENR